MPVMEDLNEIQSSPVSSNTGVLKDVVAFVEVRSKAENRSRAVAKQLELLGARVSPKLTDDVTHLVWKEGKNSNKTKAMKKGIHLVSVLWVESCRQNQEHVSEVLFPILSDDDTAALPMVKKRRMKSMQPCTLEEDMQKMEAKYEKKWKKKIAAFNADTLGSPGTPNSIRDHFSPAGSIFTPPLRIIVPKTPPSMREKMRIMRENQALKLGLSCERPVVGRSPLALAEENPTPDVKRKRLFSFSNLSSESSDEDSHLQKLLSETLSKKVKSLKRARSKKQLQDSPSTSHPLFDLSENEACDDGDNFDGKEDEEIKDSSKLLHVRNIDVENEHEKRKLHPDDVNMGRSFVRQTDQNPNQKERRLKSLGDVGNIIHASPNRRRSMKTVLGNTEQSNILSSDQKRQENGQTSNMKVVSRRRSVRTKKLVTASNESDADNLLHSTIQHESTSNQSSGLVVDDDRAKKRSMSLSDVGNIIHVSSDEVGQPIQIKTLKEKSKKLRYVVKDPDVGKGQENEMKSNKNGKPTSRRRSVKVPTAMDTSETSQTESLDDDDDNILLIPIEDDKRNVHGQKSVCLDLDDVKDEIKQSVKLPSKRSVSLGGLDNIGLSTKVVMASEHSGSKNTINKRLNELKQTSESQSRRKSVSWCGNVGGGEKVQGEADLMLNKNTRKVEEPRRRRSISRKTDAEEIGDSESGDKASEEKTDKNRQKSVLHETEGNLELPVPIDDNTQNSRPTKKRKLFSANSMPLLTEQLIEPRETTKYKDKETIVVEKASGRPRRKSVTKIVSEKRRADSVPETNVNAKKRHKQEEFRQILNSMMSSSDDDSDDESASQTVVTEIRKGRKSIDDFNLAVASARKKRLRPVDSMSSESENEWDQPDNTKSKKSVKRRKLVKNKPKKTLVMTSIPKCEQDLVLSVVKKLQGFDIVDSVVDNTTHVVCGGNRRTLNVLSAIARGCWLLSMEWVLKSLEASKWVEEEPYELHDFFPAAQISRLEKQANGVEDDYRQDIFITASPLYIAENSLPPQNRLTELVTLCGGTVCNTLRTARLCVGKTKIKNDVPMIEEKWILDCITQHAILPLDGYYIQ
ncbi:uncharacterized protein LOC102805140 [Saccoglossus kowalevskii]